MGKAINNILSKATKLMRVFSNVNYNFNTNAFISHLMLLANTFNRPFAIAESIDFNKDFVWPPEIYIKDISLLKVLGSIEKVANVYKKNSES